MSDSILQNCTTVGGDSIDIEIQDGVIDRVVPAGEGDASAYDPADRYDVDGNLVTPTVTESHTHLFNALSEGNPHTNDVGTLEQAWQTGEKNSVHRTEEVVKKNARRVLNWFVSYGVTRVRSHLSLTASKEGPFTAAEAMLEIKEEYSDIVDLQLVGVPDRGYIRDEEKFSQFETLLDMGIDVVGGWPHREDTREYGVEHTRAALDLATEHDLLVDLHIDETDDPNSRYTEVLATEAMERGIGDRTTASHVTAMHSYPNAYADKLSRLLAESGVSVITNPLSNSVLQGRYDDYPKRRGFTRLDELADAGVTVGIGHDDIGDSANPYGDGDPLKVLYFLAHFAHKNRLGDETQLWNMLLRNNAEIFGLNPRESTLTEGTEGSVVVYDSPSAFDAIRTIAPRTLVMKDGQVIARTSRDAQILSNDIGAVDFSKEDI
ncbi:amidohydrolase family protein [Haloarcula sp. S1CR25-12]|uniref:Amidohydrolase family protein n=1 Tax=Haloarcula saliterrae TaxID=2950534 RepID=A0ABU2FH71_9EURY|nr:amidohydrolase family protein [Haloarcula sp. S1CR25-12]MDS0261136.1 amidohydrolase family protein [Haloarcula sp. S1CR25-12]